MLYKNVTPQLHATDLMINQLINQLGKMDPDHMQLIVLDFLLGILGSEIMSCHILGGRYLRHFSVLFLSLELRRKTVYKGTRSPIHATVTLIQNTHN
jgi:hypothetical protein